MHAKVFVFDNMVIIGSPNVSSHSKSNLVETAVLVKDPNVVNSARGFVASLMTQSVTPAYVRALKKDYHPPRLRGGARRSTGAPQNSQPQLWIERIDPVDFDKRENQLTRIGKQAARRKARNTKKYSIEVVRYPRFGLGKRTSIGDFMMQIEPDEDGSFWVYPPSRIVHFKAYINSKGARRILVFTETLRNPMRLQWKVIRAVLKRAQVPNLSEKMGREIRNPSLKQELFGVWTDSSGS